MFKDTNKLFVLMGTFVDIYEIYFETKIKYLFVTQLQRSGDGHAWIWRIREAAWRQQLHSGQTGR